MRKPRFHPLLDGSIVADGKDTRRLLMVVRRRPVLRVSICTRCPKSVPIKVVSAGRGCHFYPGKINDLAGKCHMWHG